MEVQGFYTVGDPLRTKIQDVVIGQGHKIHTHLREHGHLFRRQTEGKLLICCLCSPVCKRELLVYHKNICSQSLLKDPLVQDSSDISGPAVRAQHMLRQVDVPGK